MKKENITVRESKRGIKIVGEYIPDVYSVSLGVWVKAGSVYETDSERGISHFIEHILFKGTTKRTAKQIASEIDAVGGSINAFTAKERTCYYTRTLGEDLALAVDVLLDMICNPLLAEDDIENEKGVVCEEILMGEDDPEDVVHEAICALAYEGFPLSYPILGTADSVNSITKQAISDYMQRRYTPENIVIACAGNFDMDELVRLVDEKYVDRHSNVQTQQMPVNEYVRKRCFVPIKRDIEQAHICISFPSIESFSEKNMCMSIVNSIFGGSASSRLFQHIREEKGLAYSVYSINTSYTQTGYWVIYAGTGENRAQEVVQCMLSELQRLKNEYITVEEFERCKNQLRRGFLLGLESVSMHASSIGKDLLCLGRVRDDKELLDALEKVTYQEVVNFIDTLIDFDAMRFAIVSRSNDEAQTNAMRDMVMNAPS